MTLRSRRILKYYCDDCQLGLKLLPKLVKKVEELTSEVEKLKASFVAPVDTNAQDFEEVLHEIEERNSRKCNIILYGVAENKDATRQQQETQDVAEVTKVPEFLSPDINTNVKPMRLGKFDRSSTRPRLIKLTLNNQQQVQKCLRNANKLSSSTEFARIRISADRTPKQVEFYKKVKCELSRRQANGEANLKIKHVRGVPRIVTEN
nr:unnamed protein product [Callosobruchus chinensis]